MYTLKGTKFGGTSLYSCDPGYLLVGPRILECLSNRTWSGLKVPSCRLLECPEPEIPDQGRVTKTGVRYGDVAMVQLAKGSSVAS